jgi:catechol 2,3-dioxygenase-like lactoylglutathione lyase family enzyme
VVVWLFVGAPPASTVAQQAAALVERVEAVGLTVGDMDRAVDFYTRVLFFEQVSETEVQGEAVERLTGVFGAWARVVRLRLGEEVLELTQYQAPVGRPAPAGCSSASESRPSLVG